MNKSKLNNTHQRFRHYRIPELPIHAVTLMVEEQNPDDGSWVVSWSICSPTDNFCRRTGRQIAIDTQATRGYTFRVVRGSDGDVFADAISILMESRALNNDREVVRFRNAMQFLITPEQTKLTRIGRLQQLAFEKMNALASFLLKVAN